MHAFIHCASYAVGISIFFSGFLPWKQTPPYLNNSNLDITCFKSSGNSPVEKLVFVVVDALRDDFISGKRNSSWSYLNDLVLKRKALTYFARAHPPTVTLPRIKAMMSGDIPGFIDVILNFDSKELKGDSVLLQLKAIGKSLVFYGDDTWLKLFPNYFVRSEGTTSFIVSDFTEVDDNVTRHLDKELSRGDWDVLILHYLGLDHIGHVEGPFSELIPSKLKEMDDVVKKLHQSLMQMASDFVLVVCGDHGMADQGGHGGVSAPEVSVPLIFISNKDLNLPDDQSKEVFQIDLAPTLASLLDVRIPVNSLGVVIPNVLASLNGLSGAIDAAIKNSGQLAALLAKDNSVQSERFFVQYDTLLKQCAQSFNSTHQSESRKEKLFNDIIKLNKDMQSQLASRLVEYDVTAMAGALLLILCVLLSVVISSPMVFSLLTVSVCGTVTALVVSLYGMICTGSHASTVLCNSTTGYSASILLTALLSKLCVSLLIGVKHLGQWLRADNSNSAPVFLSFLHSLSLLASSFIEEEHQLVYFFSTSLMVGVFVLSLAEAKKSLRLEHIYPLGVMFLMSVARKWNQTGDKWAHLPDIADMLTRPANVTYRTWFAISSVWLIMAVTVPKERFSQLSMIVASIATTFYVLQDVGFYNLGRRGCLEAAVVYLCALSEFCYAVCRWICCRTRSGGAEAVEMIRFSWVILTILLHKTANLPLMAMIVTIESLVTTCVSNAHWRSTSLIYYWIGQASYFYQGNSNSLSSIDVSSGYKGLLSYNPIVTGLLILCNTYSGPIYWMLSLLLHLLKVKPYRWSAQESSSLFFVMKLLDLCVLLFLIIIERYHLFVWTVFAPKFLYEICSVSLFAVFYFLCNFKALFTKADHLS